jgi:hypothetical protein
MVRFEGFNLVLFDEVKITGGYLLDVWLGPWHITVPMSDIVVIPKITVGFEWIWQAIWQVLDYLTVEYYAKRK